MWDRCLGAFELRVSTHGAPGAAPAPIRGGVTNWAHEAGRWFRNGPVGGVGLWRKFRHCYASDDGCPCSNSGTDHDGRRDHDRRTCDDYGTDNNCRTDNDCGSHYDDYGTDDYCGSNYDCSTHDHSRADYDSGPDDHSDGTNHHNLGCFINDCCFVSTRIG